MSVVYIISRQTKAIIFSSSAYYRSIILEGTKRKESIQYPEKILDHSCLMYGSTLEGRKKAAQNILKTNVKLPIAVIPDLGVYMVPTSSHKNKDRAYISYFHIKDYKQVKNKTLITFKDETEHLIETSINSFDMQYKKTSQLIVHFHREVIDRNHANPFIDPYIKAKFLKYDKRNS